MGKVTYNFKNGDTVVVCTKKDGPTHIGHIVRQEICYGHPSFVISIDYPKKSEGVKAFFRMDNLLHPCYTTRSKHAAFLQPRLATEDDMKAVQKKEALDDMNAVLRGAADASVTYDDVITLTTIIKEFLAGRKEDNE